MAGDQGFLPHSAIIFLYKSFSMQTAVKFMAIFLFVLVSGISFSCIIDISLFDFIQMGAKPTTITGLSGTGDIMLTCFVNLSRNRTVGVRLGSGEKLDDILGSMNQVLYSCTWK